MKILEARIIDLLREPATPVSNAWLAGKLDESWNVVETALDAMKANGFVEQICCAPWKTWALSPKSVALLKGDDALAAAAEEDDVAIATVCLDEEDLDAWWLSLDVEQKADAFAELKRLQDELHDEIEPHELASPEEAIAREVKEELNLQATGVNFIGHYAFPRMNQIIIAYHVPATGNIVLSDELVDYKRIEPAKARYWPSSTGLALRDWLLMQGHTPIAMDLPKL